MLSNTKWGANKESLIHVYPATIKSKIDYGSIAYESAPKSYLQKLALLEKSAIRMAIGAFHTSPINSIYCEAEVITPEHRRMLLTIKYANSLSFKKHHPSFNKFFNIRYPNIQPTNKKYKPGANYRYKET